MSHLVPAGKAACKRALQKELGWNDEPDRMLVGFIGRLDFQKGPDLVLDAIPDLVQRNCQVRPSSANTCGSRTRRLTLVTCLSNVRSWCRW